MCGADWDEDHIKMASKSGQTGMVSSYSAFWGSEALCDSSELWLVVGCIKHLSRAVCYRLHFRPLVNLKTPASILRELTCAKSLEMKHYPSVLFTQLVALRSSLHQKVWEAWQTWGWRVCHPIEKQQLLTSWNFFLWILHFVVKMEWLPLGREFISLK